MWPSIVSKVDDRLGERSAGSVFQILKPNGSFMFHTPNSIGYATVTARLMPDFVKLKMVPFLQGRPRRDVFSTTTDSTLDKRSTP
jgi:hypothetical protein